MAALELALKGSKYVLFDVQLANDGAAVVIKDSTTGRTTEKDMNVAQTSSAELAKLNFKGGGGTVPLLKDMMDECRKKGAKVVLQVQENSQALLTEISDYVRKYDLYSSVVVTSYTATVPFFMKRHDPKMLTGLIFLHGVSMALTIAFLFDFFLFIPIAYRISKSDFQRLSYNRFGTMADFIRSHPGSLFYKFLAQIIDDSMQFLVGTFLLPRFVGSDVIFLGQNDVSVNFVKEAKSRKMMVVALDADSKTAQEWLRDVAEIPYFTRNLKDMSGARYTGHGEQN
ncbi:hypothetical protein ANCCAN_00916 [Ancylostoma caninum]|uniref:GP-PDE domain-containing protein n=1 Tax=Ancylostoma caninum TaxID=29170 RepID=A0A368H8J9_ANCCA|nr:hypothetical protein ANCCAN_00916 [Ancylostoma caninum]